MKYSGPFWKVILPRKVTILSLTARLTLMSSRPLKSTALCTVTTLAGSMPYLFMTMFLVRSLTVTTQSAASIPLFSIAYTLESTMSSEPRSKEVACTCTTRGFPVSSFAAIPAR